MTVSSIITQNIRRRRERKKTIDDIDIAIMTELKKYPAPSMRTVAKTVNRSHAVINYRYQWLARNGYIEHSPSAAPRAHCAKVLTVKGFQTLANLGPRDQSSSS
jgi:hypothetical protein